MKYRLLLGVVFLILLTSSSYAYKTCTLEPFREVRTNDENNYIAECDTKDPYSSGKQRCRVENDASGEEKYTYIQYDVTDCSFEITESNIIEARLIFGMFDKSDAEHTDVGLITADEYVTNYNDYKMELIKYDQVKYIINDLRDNSCCSLTSDKDDVNCDCDITNTLKNDLDTSWYYDHNERISFQWHMDDSCRSNCDPSYVMGWNPENKNRKAELFIKINEPPDINCPNFYMNEDSEAGWLADLNSYTSDDGAYSELNYFIISQSNTNLINCYLDNNKFICNNPKLNSYGYSDIKVRVQDKYGLSDEDDFRINVRPVDDPAVWKVLENKELDEDTNETIIYENLKLKCSDIDSPIDMKLNSVSEHYELSFLNNDLVISNLEENYYGNEIIELDCNNVLNSFDLIINAVNDAPIFLEILDIEVYDNETINLDLYEYASDVDNEELNFSAESEFCSINESILFCENLIEGLFNVLLKVSDGLLEAETNFSINVLKFEIQEDPEPDPPAPPSSSGGSSGSGGRKITIIEEIVEEKILPIVEEIPKIEEKVVEEVKEAIEVKESKSIWKYILYIFSGIFAVIVLVIVGYFFKYINYV